ncbi:LysM domain [Dillenia turbinata]|uniref:LysM domain n=1 Tax=Dillenia turbinata TaxID=194707 RepID=A0AAN8U6V8_9MAGN
MLFSFDNFSFFIIIIFFSFCSHCSHGQQTYSTSQTSCFGNEESIQGYLCNGPLETCDSYITFRSHHPYDSAISIAYLLGAEASQIAFVNNITLTTSKIPEDTLIMVPISCSCTGPSGDYYQHNTLYRMNESDTYFTIANYTYQGLTACRALSSQNNYNVTNLTIGTQVLVPLTCACPRSNQIAAGVRFLLTYMVAWGDNLTKIAETFETDAQSLAEANRLSMDSILVPFNPLLVPLKNQTCSAKPESFFCRCTNGFNGTASQMCSRTDHSTGFPVKLAVLIGISPSLSLCYNAFPDLQFLYYGLKFSPQNEEL